MLYNKESEKDNLSKNDFIFQQTHDFLFFFVFLLSSFIENNILSAYLKREGLLQIYIENPVFSGFVFILYKNIKFKPL